MERALDWRSATELPAKSLMYQSGYLTIKGLSKTDVDEIGNPKLILGAPNHEVRGAIRAGWFNAIVKVPSTEFDALVDVAKRQVAAGDLRCLIGESLYRIYAKIPPEWKIRSEADVKRHFRLFMEMLGPTVVRGGAIDFLNGTYPAASSPRGRWPAGPHCSPPRPG